MIEKLADYLRDMPDRYPRLLESRYPRIAEEIAQRWGEDGFEDYLDGLVVADSEHRQGFPPEVAAEILRLSLAYAAWKRKQEEEPIDPWAFEKPMDDEEREAFLAELARRGLALTPEWMFRLAEAGETATLRDFLRAGMEVDVRRAADQWTPLMVALFNGREETALMLLLRGADVRARGRHGYEPIHWAALNGYARAVRFILDKGGDPSATTEFGFAPLLQAAARGHAEVVRLLVERGADVRHATPEGYTALHKACANGHVEVVQYLLAHGADPDAPAADGSTPRSIARQSGKPLLAALFST